MCFPLRLLTALNANMVKNVVTKKKKKPTVGQKNNLKTEDLKSLGSVQAYDFGT